MSDAEEVGSVAAGTFVGVIVGVALGVALRSCVIVESSWSTFEVVLCSVAVCGVLSMIFHRSVVWFVKELLRLWGIYWFHDD